MVAQGQVPGRSVVFQRLGEAIEDIDAELALEIGRIDLPKFQEQNELANQPVIVAQGHAAGDGQFAAGRALDIRAKVFFVLIVRTAEVAE